MHAGIQGGGQAAQQGEGGLGAAFFDAPDLAGCHVYTAGQAGDAEAQGATLIMDGLAEGQGFADGDPLRIFCSPGRADPAGGSRSSHLPSASLRGKVGGPDPQHF